MENLRERYKSSEKKISDSAQGAQHPLLAFQMICQNAAFVVPPQLRSPTNHSNLADCDSDDVIYEHDLHLR